MKTFIESKRYIQVRHKRPLNFKTERTIFNNPTNLSIISIKQFPKQHQDTKQTRSCLIRAHCGPIGGQCGRSLHRAQYPPLSTNCINAIKLLYDNCASYRLAIYLCVHSLPLPVTMLWMPMIRAWNIPRLHSHVLKLYVLLVSYFINLIGK